MFCQIKQQLLYLVFNTAANNISTSLVIEVENTNIDQNLWQDRGGLFLAPMTSVICTNLSNVGSTIKLSLSTFWWIVLYLRDDQLAARLHAHPTFCYKYRWYISGSSLLMHINNFLTTTPAIWCRTRLQWVRDCYYHTDNNSLAPT